MLTICHNTFKEKISVLDIYNPESDVKDVWYTRQCWIQRQRCMELPKTINGKKETWCWKDKVDEAIKQKCTPFNIYKAVDNKSKSNEVEKTNAAYTEAKSEVWKVRTEAEKDKFANILPNNGSIFKIAKTDG